jgi:hypothetical protein
MTEALERIAGDFTGTLEESVRTYETIDVYARGTEALYTPPLKVYDFPGTNTSLHIHGSPCGNTLFGGRFKERGTNRVLKELNGYECSMLDHLYGKELGLPNKRWK